MAEMPPARSAAESACTNGEFSSPATSGRPRLNHADAGPGFSRSPSTTRVPTPVKNGLHALTCGRTGRPASGPGAGPDARTGPIGGRRRHAQAPPCARPPASALLELASRQAPSLVARTATAVVTGRGPPAPRCTAARASSRPPLRSARARGRADPRRRCPGARRTTTAPRPTRWAGADRPRRGTALRRPRCHLVGGSAPGRRIARPGTEVMKSSTGSDLPCTGRSSPRRCTSPARRSAR